MNHSKRIDYIDLLRGIGIVLMTIGHVGFTVNIEKWIYAFHMPLFYCISGWFYKDNIPLMEKTKKLSLKLLVPYFSFGIMYYLIWIIVNWPVSVNDINVLDPLTHLLFVNTDGIAISPALWFLTSLFWVEIIYCLLDKILHKQVVLLSFVIVVLAAIGIGLPAYLNVRLPWALDTAFVGIGFYHIARIIKDNIHLKVFQMSRVRCSGIAVLLLIVSTISALLNGYVNMRQGLYACIPLFWVNAVMMITSVWLCVWMIAPYTDNKWFQWLKSVGKNSITYVCLNHLVVKALLYLAVKSDHNGLFIHSLILLVSLGVLWILDWIVRKTPLKFILGQLGK